MSLTQPSRESGILPGTGDPNEADVRLGRLLSSVSGQRSRREIRELKKALKGAGYPEATTDLYLYAAKKGLGGFRVSRPS